MSGNVTPTTKRILAVFLLILIAGLSVIALTYREGQRVMQVGRALAEESVPRLETISRLRNALVAQKPLFYEYYATTDRAEYLQRITPTQLEVHKQLRILHEMQQATPELARIEAANDDLQRHAGTLDNVLKSKPVDWDLARETLADISKAEARVLPELEALVEINRQQVQRHTQETQERTTSIIQVVTGFISFGLIFTLFAAYFSRLYLQESAARKLLADFPERNPHPVLGLKFDGAIEFANNATRELAAQLQITHIEELLPPDYIAQLPGLHSQPDRRASWDYQVRDRSFSCTAQLLPDLRVYHLYLSDTTERRRAEHQLIEQANHDSVTGLPNRRLFRAELESLLERGRGMCAVTLIRPDRIKLVLESQGYTASDNLMRALADRLLTTLANRQDRQPTAHLFRFEGATFGLLVRNLRAVDELELLLDELQLSVSEPLIVEDREFFFTLSIGIAINPQHGSNTETLFKNAEAAVNRVRAEGGNAYRHYTEDLSERTEQWLTVERGLRRALERKELCLYYQPQVDLSTGRIIGVEALMRWLHPERGIVPPNSFIPVAEETGLIMPMGAWALETACQEAVRWHEQGHELIMAVNISARQFNHPGLVALVEKVLRETGLPPNFLELELTESVAMQDVQRTTATLHALRALGVLLSIDDFGTGFSSLSYLQRFPLSKLKVDRSFVNNLSSDPNDANIAHTVILLGHSLQLRVIAEGVETREQIDILREYGCEEMQGFYFSRPIPAGEIDALLREGRQLAA